MSSFQLSDVEFQLISDFLYNQACSKQSKHAFTIKKALGFSPSKPEFYDVKKDDVKEKVKYFVRGLYDLNRIALVTRYGDIYDRNDKTFYIPKFTDSVIEKKAIHSLQSLSYQCGEYIAEDTYLYKNLKSLIGELCENIFNINNPLCVNE